MNRFQTRSPITPPAQLAHRFLLFLKLLPILTVAALLAACPSPGGGGGTPPAATYTTTVKGTVVTPARAADPTKGAVITTAQVWASTDPTKKVSVDTTDGSYTLQVTDHPGTFTLTADYTATDGNYKAGAPQGVTTTATAHTQNVALKYGHTITISGLVADDQRSTGGTITAGSGATVTAAAEGRVVNSVTANATGNYRITFDHPGTFQLRASLGTPPNVRSDVFDQLVRNTNPTMNSRNFLLIP